MISRLYSSQIAAARRIKLYHFNNELDQLVADCNRKLDTAGGTITTDLSVTGDVTASGEVISGSRGLLRAAYYTGTIAAGTLLKFSGINGAITGYSAHSRRVTHAATATFVLNFQKNDVTLFSSSSISHTATGVVTARNTYNEGVHTFTNTDDISIVLTPSATGGGTTYLSILLEVMFSET